MAAMMIRCPRTGQPVSTEIETEPSVFERLPAVEARMRCPVCGDEHLWTVGEARLAEPTLVPKCPADES